MGNTQTLKSYNLDKEKCSFAMMSLSCALAVAGAVVVFLTVSSFVTEYGGPEYEHRQRGTLTRRRDIYNSSTKHSPGWSTTLPIPQLSNSSRLEFTARPSTLSHSLGIPAKITSTMSRALSRTPSATLPELNPMKGDATDASADVVTVTTKQEKAMVKHRRTNKPGSRDNITRKKATKETNQDSNTGPSTAKMTLHSTALWSRRSSPIGSTVSYGRVEKTGYISLEATVPLLKRRTTHHETTRPTRSIWFRSSVDATEGTTARVRAAYLVDHLPRLQMGLQGHNPSTMLPDGFTRNSSRLVSDGRRIAIRGRLKTKRVTMRALRHTVASTAKQILRRKSRRRRRPVKTEALPTAGLRKRRMRATELSHVSVKNEKTRHIRNESTTTLAAGSSKLTTTRNTEHRIPWGNSATRKKTFITELTAAGIPVSISKSTPCTTAVRSTAKHRVIYPWRTTQAQIIVVVPMLTKNITRWTTLAGNVKTGNAPKGTESPLVPSPRSNDIAVSTTSSSGIRQDHTTSFVQPFTHAPTAEVITWPLRIQNETHMTGTDPSRHNPNLRTFQGTRNGSGPKTTFRLYILKRYSASGPPAGPSPATKRKRWTTVTINPYDPDTTSTPSSTDALVTPQSDTATTVINLDDLIYITELYR